jgi:hypothetical protein
MIAGPATKRPMISTLPFLDWKIAYAGNTQAHQAVLVYDERAHRSITGSIIDVDTSRDRHKRDRPTASRGFD